MLHLLDERPSYFGGGLLLFDERPSFLVRAPLFGLLVRRIFSVIYKRI